MSSNPLPPTGHLPASPDLPGADGDRSPQENQNAQTYANNTSFTAPLHMDQPCSTFPVLNINDVTENTQPSSPTPTPTIQSLSDDSSTLPPLSEDSGRNALPEGEESSSSLPLGLPETYFPPIILEEPSSSSQFFVFPTGMAEDSLSASDSFCAIKEVSKTGRRSALLSDEPPTKVRKLSSSSDDRDGETCPVCLEPWGNSGDHRLVALKCGHLFGANCVERWLRASPARRRTCPTCKTRASVKDMRPIYARRLVAVDTAELSAMRRRLDLLHAEKERAVLELHQTLLAQRARLQQQYAAARSLRPPRDDPPAAREWRFALEKSIEVPTEAGCRVLVYNCRSCELYVTQQSTSGLFRGWGVRKVSCAGYGCGQLRLLHQTPILDAAYSPTRDLLLTAGRDGCARLSSGGIVVHSIQTGMPLWACAWDARCCDTHFYTGGVGDSVLQYDLRNVSQPCARLATPSPTTSVVSLQSTEEGLLSCRLNSCALWSSEGAGWTKNTLPVEGIFMSMKFEALSRRTLLTCRPHAGERSSLLVYQLRRNGCRAASRRAFVQERSFPLSTRPTPLCRAAWVSAGDTLWAAAYSDGALQLCDVTGVRHASLLCSEPALDAVSFKLSDDTLLATLGQTRLLVYKAVPSYFEDIPRAERRYTFIEPGVWGFPSYEYLHTYVPFTKIALKCFAENMGNEEENN